MRYTGHGEGTIARWLERAGDHCQVWHQRYLRHLIPLVLQFDELHAWVRSLKGTRRLWLVIDPSTKLIPALHLGVRKKRGCLCGGSSTQALACAGLGPVGVDRWAAGLFFSHHRSLWPVGAADHRPLRGWQVDEQLLYGQLVKRTHCRKLVYTLTRILSERREALTRKLRAADLSGLIQTVFIERVNLTIRQSLAPLRRKTWSLAQTEAALLAHVEWRRRYYHFGRSHTFLGTPLASFKGRCRPRTPAVAAGLTDRVWTVGALPCTLIILPKS